VTTDQLDASLRLKSNQCLSLPSDALPLQGYPPSLDRDGGNLIHVNPTGRPIRSAPPVGQTGSAGDVQRSYGAAVCSIDESATAFLEMVLVTCRYVSATA
jgi:hypothetical protein